MAKSTAVTKKKAVANFDFTEEAKKNPRRLYINGKWVGIGGEIEIPGKPPKAAIKIPVATNEELAEVAQYMPHLIIVK